MNETLQIVIWVGVSVGLLYQLLHREPPANILILAVAAVAAGVVFLGAAGWL
jgi:predicted anti-sigma-YlaC factor YlaD